MIWSGVHQGARMRLDIGWREPLYVTVWDGILLLKRNSLPHRCLKVWRGYMIAGGRFWREIPHPMVKNPLSSAYYEDTLMSAITWPARPLIRYICGR